MLFKRELKRNLRSFLVVSFICSLLVMYVISLAPSFGKDIQQILDLKLPKPLQSAFGMSSLDFGTPLGFFGIVFSYVYLFTSIYAAGMFANIMLKEFSDKTAEYLFALPMKRVQVISNKLFAGILYCLLSILCIMLISVVSFSVFIKEDYSVPTLLLMSCSWLLGSLTFGSLAFLISSFLSKTRSSQGMATGTVLVFYMLQVVISLNKELDFLVYISPFDWFKGNEIARTGELEISYIIIAVLVTAVFFIVGTMRYRKKDVLI